MREKPASSTDSREVVRSEASPGVVHGVTSDLATHPHPYASALAQGDSELAHPVEKAYFEQIIENAPEAVSIVDEDHRILRVNREFTRLFGFSAAEANGQTLEKLIVPPDRYAETAWIAQNVKTGTNLSLETRRQSKDGSLVEVLLSTAPVMLHGKRIGGYASYRDISEQKRAEELNAALYAIAARASPPKTSSSSTRRSTTSSGK